ncbi:MAG: type IV toxin-antitoxin system AbiEi family antitoxin domain-containing protein [Solirubrobacteraceae bacterium]
MSHQNPDAAVARLAARQHGNITRAQLTECGLGAASIAWRVRRGRLFRVHLGVYAVGRPPVTPLERACAAVLAGGPGAALSHGSALALWGFSDRWPPSFDLVVALDRRPRGITVHRPARLAHRDIRSHLGIRATSPARTILDCAPGLEAKALTRLVNDALRSPWLTHAALADMRARFVLHPGTRPLDAVLETASHGVTRSALEDDFLAFCRRFGLPTPVMNGRVAGYEVDAMFVEQRVIVELDGWEFHGDRASFEDNRDRDADTLAAGWRTVRITHPRLHDRPEREAERLREILSWPPPA